MPSRPPLDPALLVPAQRIVEGALALGPGQRLVLACDRAHLAIANAVEGAAGDVGATVARFVLEDLAPRPHIHLRGEIRDALLDADASLLLISLERDELEMRAAIVGTASKARLRHAHAVGVSPSALIAGAMTDPRRIDAIAREFLRRVRPTSTMHVRSPAGTDLMVRFSPSCRWIAHGGVIPQGSRGDLPSGEVGTSPSDVSGVYVADGTVADSSGALLRKLEHHPLRLHLEAGVVRRISCADDTLARTVEESLRRAVHLDRAGVISLGTNVGMLEPVGEIFADQKVPAFHLALGSTLADLTGQEFRGSSWLAMTASKSDVDLDGEPIMRAGRWLVG